MIEVALVGRANSGKTSLLMHLTGSAQRPVNFAGSSVERVTSVVTVGDVTLRVVDLPGIASLHAVSKDEEVTLDYLRDPAGPDVICAVLDASKLRIELGLLRSLAELGKPLVVALNKNDVARSEGRPVNAAALAELLRIPVLETDGFRGKGTSLLSGCLVSNLRSDPPDFEFSTDEIAKRVQSAPARVRTRTDRIDSILLHPLLGLPILLVVMFGTFQLVFTGADPFVSWIENGQSWLSEVLVTWMAEGAVRSFILDGLVNGLGSVLVFLPQIVLLIAFVTVLEASGYMARAAFLLDRTLSRVGLNGRSFVPLTTSFACAIPGILASRIISDERDRIATIVVAPLMSCSARLPVYAVLTVAFFPVAWAGVVLFGLYAMGILTAAVVATVVRRTVLRGGASPLMMELPSYQRPSFRVVWGQVRSASRRFVLTAGNVILVTSIAIWFLSYYPRPDAIHQSFETARREVVATHPESGAALARLDAKERSAYLEQSFLASIGKQLQPVFASAGFDWRTTMGVVAAFPARELIVPTMGILYSLGDVDAGSYDLEELAAAEEHPDGLRERLRNAKRADGTPSFGPLVAVALMVFFALCSQCAATLGTIRRETRSWRWPVFTFAYMTTVAWLAAVSVYQVGCLLGLGASA